MSPKFVVLLGSEDEGRVYGRGNAEQSGVNTIGNFEDDSFEASNETDYIDEAMSWLDRFLAEQSGTIQRGYPHTTKKRSVSTSAREQVHPQETSPLLSQWREHSAQ